jgi:ferredoxin
VPTLEILASELGPAIRAELPGGGRVLDACDDHRAPVDFSCRSASCGTCRVEVIAGADLLASPGPDEREVLSLFATSPRQRLACQAVIQPGSGLVQLRWVND